MGIDVKDYFLGPRRCSGSGEGSRAEQRLDPETGATSAGLDDALALAPIPSTDDERAAAMGLALAPMVAGRGLRLACAADSAHFGPRPKRRSKLRELHHARKKENPPKRRATIATPQVNQAASDMPSVLALHKAEHKMRQQM
jgi:hypothetical protein